jgi:hypothetical protein
MAFGGDAGGLEGGSPRRNFDRRPPVPDSIPHRQSIENVRQLCRAPDGVGGLFARRGLSCAQMLVEFLVPGGQFFKRARRGPLL